MSSNTASVENLCGLMFQGYPDVLNLEQMSEILHVSTKTGSRLLKEGTIKSLKIGKSYRIPKPYLITYLCGMSQDL